MTPAQLPDFSLAPRVDRSRLLRGAISRRLLTLPLLRLWPSYRGGEVVGRDTDYCVDGYPFSANTFAYVSVLDSNRDLHGAHHTHASAQLLVAAKRGVPTALVVREPLEVTESIVVFDGGVAAVRHFLSEWVDFHTRLMAVIEHGQVVVCPFDRVIADPSYVVRALNYRFGTSLLLPSSPAEELKARAQTMRDARGMPARSTYEDTLDENLDQLRKAIRQDSLAPRATALYERLLAYAPAADELATSS
jgi:hypothetical protein